MTSREEQTEALIDAADRHTERGIVYSFDESKCHDFNSDWYRPARCLNCGYRREHPIHSKS